MEKKRWIGVFGGSFNPPHLGHLLAAIYALKVVELDEVWFVPAYRHAFEKDLLPFQDRLEMCRILIAGLGSKLKVSTIEKDIKSDGKMLKTLESLQKKHKDKAFSLVIGSDILKQTKKWHRFSEIERKFMVVVIPRGTSTRGELAIPDISSTEVRRRIKKNESISDFLTPDVAEYLRRI